MITLERDVRGILAEETKEYNLYHARVKRYETGNKIPFRVSPNPLELSIPQAKEVREIGRDVACFFQAAFELYQQSSTVREILNLGKPEIFLIDRPLRYLFLRPDLIITEEGFTLCEIETSPFGLALAEALKNAYNFAGYETIDQDIALKDHVQRNTEDKGTIIYSKTTGSYEGQMMYLADKVFSGDKRTWIASQTDDNVTNGNVVYRAFYLHEYQDDQAVRDFVDKAVFDPSSTLPSLTPQMEEKAVLAFLWDKRFEGFFKRQLGFAAFNHLRQVVPRTWIVGQEKYFADGLPEGVERSSDLASITKAKRTLVLKTSGFNKKGSWSEGVVFLHKKSQEAARTALQNAESNNSSLYIVQEFKEGKKIPSAYLDDEGNINVANCKVRLTPYFSMDGELIAIKASGCENTDYIHASSTSINTGVTKKAA